MILVELLVVVEEELEMLVFRLLLHKVLVTVE